MTHKFNELQVDQARSQWPSRQLGHSLDTYVSAHLSCLVPLLTRLRYRACPLPEWIKEYLGLRDIRDLENLDERTCPRWRDLKSKLNNVRVEYTSDRVRQRKIRGIVPRAGEIEFERDGELITIEVCPDVSVSDMTMPTQSWAR